MSAQSTCTSYNNDFIYAPQHPSAHISASYPCASGFLGVRHPWGDNNGVVALADLSEGQNGIDDLDLLNEHYDIFVRKMSPLRYMRARSDGGSEGISGCSEEVSKYKD